VAGHGGAETVVAAGLFQRRGTLARIGDEGGLPGGAAPEPEAPGLRSNTILAVTGAGGAAGVPHEPRPG